MAEKYYSALFLIGSEAKNLGLMYTNTLVEGTVLALLLILLFTLSRALSPFCFEQKLFKSFSHTYPFYNASERSAFIPTSIFMTSLTICAISQKAA